VTFLYTFPVGLIAAGPIWPPDIQTLWVVGLASMVSGVNAYRKCRADQARHAKRR